MQIVSIAKKMHKTRRFKINKLIRDKIPEIMHASGVKATTYIMPEEEYLQSLKDKLMEEAREVSASQSKEEIAKELADVLEVMLATANAYKISFADIEKIAEQKRSEKGGFNRRVYACYVELDKDHPDIELYASRLDEYIDDNKNAKSD